MKHSLMPALALALALWASPAHPQPREKLFASETAEERAARMAWWKEARFGMFIHWGLYSVLGGSYRGEKIGGTGEWIQNMAPIPVEEYEKLAHMFNPVFFDADEWVSVAKDAGMRYIVITSKHHDGFALWDSDVSDWDVVERTPFARDILDELAEACREQDIKLCFYHSIMDWHHPQAQGSFYPKYNDPQRTNPEFPLYLENYLKPQLRELLTGYGDIGVLWFDGEWISDYTTEMGKEIDRFVRALQPDILVNNRVDKGRQGMQGLDREGDFAGDFGTPEQEIPDTGLPGVDWESCMTMNHTWGWRGDDRDWKSAEQLIAHLVDVVSKGGNYLLNVGPTHEGVIPQPSIDRLRAMGAWLESNGEAIYGAAASPFPQPTWGAYTQKGSALYAHLLRWPEATHIYVPYLDPAEPYQEAIAIASKQPLVIDRADKGAIIHLPAPLQSATLPVIRLR